MQARTKSSKPRKVALSRVPNEIKICLQVIYEACGFTKEEAQNQCITAKQGTPETHAWKEALLLIYSQAKIKTKVKEGGKLYVRDTPGDVVGPHMAHEAIMEETSKKKSDNELPMLLKCIIHEVGSRLAKFEDDDYFPKEGFMKAMKNVVAVQMSNKDYSDVRCKVVTTNEHSGDELVSWLRRVYELDEKYDLSDEGFERTIKTVRGYRKGMARGGMACPKEWAERVVSINNAKKDPNITPNEVDKALQKIAEKKKKDMTVTDDEDKGDAEDDQSDRVERSAEEEENLELDEDEETNNEEEGGNNGSVEDGSDEDGKEEAEDTLEGKKQVCMYDDCI